MKKELLKNKDVNQSQTTTNIKFKPLNAECRLKHSYEVINNLELLIYDNKRVITTRQITEVFGINNNKLFNNFYKHKHNFHQNEDYYFLQGDELRNFHISNNLSEYPKYCWTQSGIMLLASILANSYACEKSMEIYQNLVEGYFETDKSESEIETQQRLQTPIEVALGIDEDGMTTARKLYEFLEMDETHYSRWIKSNITDNPFAEENVDYEVLAINGENPKGGRPTQDFKLSATFAKKLCMQGKTERAEQAREYFIKVEEKLKEFVIDNSDIFKRYTFSNRFRYHTSSTKVPKVKDSAKRAKLLKLNDWFYNNYNKIEIILNSFGWERSYLYHVILTTLGQEYDLQAAQQIYQREMGIPTEYAMDIVEYFDELSIAATKIVNKLVNGVNDVNQLM